MSAVAATEELFGKEAVVKFEQSTGGEDFSYFTRKRPLSLCIRRLQSRLLSASPSEVRYR